MHPLLALCTLCTRQRGLAGWLVNSSHSSSQVFQPLPSRHTRRHEINSSQSCSAPPMRLMRNRLLQPIAPVTDRRRACESAALGKSRLPDIPRFGPIGLLTVYNRIVQAPHTLG
ncbi:hypothetical protein GGR57DRAFT_471005 [Xylariaceae sp. FL1272]|nr:hypothetical protein GGR57DRAFT_471005 [Xylariaceae sp. FL1272]